MKSIRSIRLLAIGALVAGAIGALAAAGCDRSEGNAVVPNEGLSSGEGAGLGPGALAGLTLDQIDSAVHLTDAQRPQMRDALDRFHSSQREMRGRMDHRRGGMKAGPMMKRGPMAGGGPMHGRGTAGGPMLGAGMERPAIGFLEDASKILTPDQFRNLAVLIKEHRDANLAERRQARTEDRRGRSGRDGWGPQGAGPLAMLDQLGPRISRELDLTQQQRDALRPVVREGVEKAMDVRDQIRSGAITRDQARDRIREIRTSTRDRVKEILTAEQWDKVQAFRRDRMGEGIDRRLSSLNDDLTRRSEFLARVLGLDSSQAEQVRSMVLGTAAARTETLNALKSGSIEPEDAAAKIHAIDETLAGQISGILNQDQKARFEALRDLLGPPER